MELLIIPLARKENKKKFLLKFNASYILNEIGVNGKWVFHHDFVIVFGRSFFILPELVSGTKFFLKVAPGTKDSFEILEKGLKLGILDRY